MDYEILSSGSKGNAVRIENIMVDCGIPFSKMKESLYECKYLLLTHIHTDHVKSNTLKSIKKSFPKIKIIGNYEVHQKHGVDIICNATYPTKTKPVITAFEAFHDVVTYGYTWEVDGKNIIYCTDTSSLENAPKNIKYDYLFLESNYDKNKIEAIEQAGNSKKRYGYDVVSGSKRHLSTQDCKAFYYMNRRSKDSELIELHKSSRFY